MFYLIFAVRTLKLIGPIKCFGGIYISMLVINCLIVASCTFVVAFNINMFALRINDGFKMSRELALLK